MRRVIGVMIAKAESRRLPGKNRQPFHGRPMFHWNLMKLVHLLPGHVYFDSDSKEMLDESGALGAIPLERPVHLRGHDVASVPLFQNIVQSIDETPEAIVNVQANSPSCRLAVIEKAVRIMQHTACDELLTAFPETHTINGSVWGFSRERLMAYGDPRIHHPDVLITDPSTDVHTEKELAAAKEEFEMSSFVSE